MSDRPIPPVTPISRSTGINPVSRGAPIDDGLADDAAAAEWCRALDQELRRAGERARHDPYLLRRFKSLVRRLWPWRRDEPAEDEARQRRRKVARRPQRYRD